MYQQILPLIPSGASPINEIASVFRDEKKWTYFVFGHPIYKHNAGDTRSFYLVAAQIIESGVCQQGEILKAFGIPKRTLENWQGKYKKGGAASFFLPPKRRKGGTILMSDVLANVQRSFDEGSSYADAAIEFGIKESTLRKAVQDGRLKRSKRNSGLTKSERTVRDAAAAEGMGTACTRTDERFFAALGLLSGASTEFTASLSVPRGGVFFALPALLANGLLEGANELLGAVRGYYTQFHILLLLGFMALCRIKTVEQLSGKAAGELGILLGLDRSPEAHCLRRKMDELAGQNNAEIWEAHLSKYWMEQNPDACGYLYVDGHVSVYHGEQTKLPRRYVSRERLCLRGISNYWVNDAIGCPFFAVEKQIDDGLLATLREDIVPRLLRDVPGQPSNEELVNDRQLCRFVIVFDREGYSPEFFKEMWEKHRIGCLTYHKHQGTDWPEAWFEEREVVLVHGEVVKMRLAEMGSCVGSGKHSCWMREIRKLTESGHQTAIIGTVFKPSPVALAPQMFARWCQENFFAYMKQHFMIDVLTEYGAEPFHGTEKVVNPAWRNLERQRGSLATKLRYRRAKFAELSLNATGQDVNKHLKWENSKAELLDEIQQYEKELENIKAEKRKIPQHVTWNQLPEQDRFNRLTTSRKRLADTVKMIAYRAETAMANLLQSPTVSNAEARSILRSLFNNEADVIPGKDGETLRIIVHGAPNPAANRAIFSLIEKLNQTQTDYPGTNLRMVFESAVSPPIAGKT